MRSALRSSQIVLRMTQQKRLNKRLSTNDSTQTTQRRRLNADQSTQTIKSSHQKAKFQLRVRPCWFLGKRACPRAYGAKRVRVRIREKEGFKHRWFWRAPCFWGAKNVETARWVNLRALVLKAFSLLRFFVALDKEMTCRHAQWLTVIKKIAH